MSSRRFEFVEGTSSKFWEITNNHREVTVRYGRIGTNGQTQTKSFTSDAAANTHALQQINSKLAKGYRELVAA
jgi:predicted DNA-binding WGR domain protein